MARLKIISNSYKKEIRYQQWDADNSTWLDVELNGHETSKLLSKELTTSFFHLRQNRLFHRSSKITKWMEKKSNYSLRVLQMNTANWRRFVA